MVLQSPKEKYTMPVFAKHKSLCTSKTTKSIKTNDIPMKSLIKLQPEMQKKILNFPKFVRFLGHFLKKKCFRKMGMAGIKWGQRSSTIPPFFMNFNEEALLKVSFKNIDWFQICPFSKTTAFSKKALKTNKFWKIQKNVLHFWWQFYRAFQWYIVCFHTFSGCWYTEGNVFAVKSHMELRNISGWVSSYAGDLLL